MRLLLALRYRAKIALVVAGLCFAFAAVPRGQPWIACGTALSTGESICRVIHPPSVASGAIALGVAVSVLAAYSFARAHSLQRRLAMR